MGITAGRSFVLNQGQMGTQRGTYLQAIRSEKLLISRQLDTYSTVTRTQSVPNMVYPHSRRNK